MNTPPDQTPFDPRWLQSSPVHIYKDDGRTRVWVIDTPRGRLVVKRFDRNAVRQFVTFLINRHPAQVEARRVKQLLRDGLPVVPVIHRGRSFADGGFRLSLIYPFAGKSLLWRLRDGDLADTARRRRVIEALAQLIANLIDHQWVHADFKTSNILLDDSEKLWVIDTGAVSHLSYGEAGRQQVAHMLATLDFGARKEGVSRTDRLRLLRRVAELRIELGDHRALADAVLHAAPK